MRSASRRAPSGAASHPRRNLYAGCPALPSRRHDPSADAAAPTEIVELRRTPPSQAQIQHMRRAPIPLERALPCCTKKSSLGAPTGSLRASLRSPFRRGGAQRLTSERADGRQPPRVFDDTSAYAKHAPAAGTAFGAKGGSEAGKVSRVPGTLQDVVDRRVIMLVILGSIAVLRARREHDRSN